MRKYHIFCLIYIAISLVSCKKAKTDTQIDVSQQHQTDYNGNTLNTLDDGQWQIKSFNESESALFKVLDSVDLSGTTTPSSPDASSAFFFPNPFGSTASLMFSFSNGFIGEVVIEYAIVDANMTLKEIGAFRVQAVTDPFFPLKPSTTAPFHLNPGIGKGKYRIYITLSAEANPNFYQTWGNIEKSN